MKIQQIEVIKLFGIFDHTINLSEQDNITIVIGENGLGKTVILEALNSLFSKEYNFFITLEFESFNLKFEEGQSWRITKRGNGHNTSLYIHRMFSDKDIKSKDEKIWSAEDHKRNRHLNHIRMKNMEYEYYLKKRALWGSSFDKDIAIELEHLSSRDSLDDILLFEENIIHRGGKKRDDSVPPKWFLEAVENIKVKLIETQRIMTFKDNGKNSYINSVQKCSDEIKEKIEVEAKKASEITLSLDSTYPNRLIKKLKQRTNESFPDLKIALTKLDERRKQLSKTGLVVESSDSDLLEIEESHEDIINTLILYIDDSYEKLQPYEDLSKKMQLFQEIINKRFKHKRLSINQNKGLVFHSTVKKNSKGDFEEIPSSRLSSGEQNELILFYKLIFNAEKGNLILIDEPELSLHISWQNKFIDDLKHVTQINNVYIIIATHSPDIINENWNLKVELTGVE